MAKFGLLSLLKKRSSQALFEGVGQHHTGESKRGLLDGKEIGDLPSRLKNDNRAAPFLDLRAAGAGLINKLADLVGDSGMPESCFPRSEFHGYRKKLVFVSLDVRPQKCDQVSRRAHIGRVSLIMRVGNQKCIPNPLPGYHAGSCAFLRKCVPSPCDVCAIATCRAFARPLLCHEGPCSVREMFSNNPQQR
jgi:hypothetical protein